MRFPTLIRENTERPTIAVMLESGKGFQYLTDALVDMGSDLTLFPLRVAKYLDIDLTSVPDRFVQSVLGARVTYRPWPVLLELRRPPSILRWKSIVGFVACPMNYGILGTRGFFEFFNVRYHLSEHWLDIEPAGPLPQ